MKKRSTAKNNLLKYFLLIATFLVCVFFAIGEPAFIKITNLLDIFRATTIIAIVGIGMTVVQAVGEFDFGIGACGSFAACLVAKIMIEWIPNFWVALVITMLASLLVGLVNYFLVVVIGIRAWIATFGMATVMGGCAKLLTGGGTYYTMKWPSGFLTLGQGYVFEIVPVQVLVLLVLAAVAYVFCERTGSLGQGASTAVGLAYADKLDHNTERFTYLIVGDGEITEGQVWEAANFAAAKELKNLIMFVDKNGKMDPYSPYTSDPNNITQRFKAFGFATQEVNGHDVSAVYDAIMIAQKQDKPSVIVLDTIKGKSIPEIEDMETNHSISVDDERLTRLLAAFEAQKKAIDMEG